MNTGCTGRSLENRHKPRFSNVPQGDADTASIVRAVHRAVGTERGGNVNVPRSTCVAARSLCEKASLTSPKGTLDIASIVRAVNRATEGKEVRP